MRNSPEGPPVTTDLESRIRQLEDRAQISEQVIKYAMGVDRRDWAEVQKLVEQVEKQAPDVLETTLLRADFLWVSGCWRQRISE